MNELDTIKPPYVDAYNMLKLLGVPVFVNEDNEDIGNFSIDAEDGESQQWVSYYDAPAGWHFGVHPTVEDVLCQFGLFAEWMNPGCLGVYEA